MRQPVRIRRAGALDERLHGSKSLVCRERQRLFEGDGEHVFFERLDDRLVVEQGFAHARPVALLELGRPIVIGGLGASLGELVQTRSVSEQLGPLEPAQRGVERLVRFDVVGVHRRLSAQHVAVLALEIGPAVHERREAALALEPVFHDVAVRERGQHVLLVLERVRQAEDTALEKYLILRFQGGVASQQTQLGFEVLDLIGNALLEVVPRRIAHAVAIRVAGVADDERESAVLHAGHRYVQVARGLHRHVGSVELGVAAVGSLIGAQNRDVGDVAREAEVHLVAAKVAELLFGRVGEPQITVVLVHDQQRLCAAVEVDGRAGEVLAVLGRAASLQVGPRRLPYPLHVGNRHAGRHAGVQLARDVGRAPFHLRHEPLAGQLVGAVLGRKAGGDEVVSGRLVALGQRRRADAVEGDVMIGENETVRRGKRPGAAASGRLEADDRPLQPHQIRGRQLYAISTRDGGERQLIQPPHPFVGPERDSSSRDKDGHDRRR
jgi:hypothetical protein